MQASVCGSRLQSGKMLLRRPHATPVQRRALRVAARAGGTEEPFNETAAQVKRLISRDRKAFLGNSVDILDKYETEFGVDVDGSSTDKKAAAPAAGAATAAPAKQAAQQPTAASTSTQAAPAPPAPPAAPPAAAAPAAAAAPKFGGPAGGASPFGAAPGASPFGASSSSSSGALPFGGSSPLSRRQSSEPKGLSPYMGPDPLAQPGPADTRNILQKITLTQVVLFGSFTTIIGIMIATFVVVVNSGAVRLAGIE